MDQIAFTIKLPESYENALEIVTSALKEQGFGVLTEIDVKATLQKKIGVDFRKYAILGACNPPLAHKALDTNPLVGLLLPCNVTVEETADGSVVNLVNPKFLLLSHPSMAENAVLQEVAADAYDRLVRVAESLAPAE